MRSFESLTLSKGTVAALLLIVAFATMGQMITRAAFLVLNGKISASGTPAKNMEGSCTFAAATTCAVTFTTNESDANFDIFIDPPANIGAVFTTAKGTTGFTINAATSNSSTVRWFLVHQ